MWDLVPWLGIEPGPPALGVWNLSHWTIREVTRIWKYYGTQQKTLWNVVHREQQLYDLLVIIQAKGWKEMINSILLLPRLVVMERQRDCSWGKVKEIASQKPHNQPLQLLSAPRAHEAVELSLHHKPWFSQVLASCSQTVWAWPGYLTSLCLCGLSCKINDGGLLPWGLYDLSFIKALWMVRSRVNFIL